jgi:hypothetical protein
MELLYWLQDVREYVRVSRRRSELRKPGAGVDFAGTLWTSCRKRHRLEPIAANGAMACSHRSVPVST